MGEGWAHEPEQHVHIECRSHLSVSRDGRFILLYLESLSEPLYHLTRDFFQAQGAEEVRFPAGQAPAQVEGVMFASRDSVSTTIGEFQLTTRDGIPDEWPASVRRGIVLVIPPGFAMDDHSERTVLAAMIPLVVLGAS